MHYGTSLNILTNLRSICEPFNYTRQIVGFYTFDGFPSTHQRDGAFPSHGDYQVPTDHAYILESTLQCHEDYSPISHISKHQLVIGDITETLQPCLIDHPELICSMVIIDVDLYESTLHILQSIKLFLLKVSLLVFMN